MVDVARDPRWGRVAEGAGEDPWLGAAFARARVRGFQGDDYAQPDRVIATAKHWVAYGASEAGRDYNTTDVTERALRETYFPPFRAAVDAGVGTLMSAFNDIDGTPATANRFTLTSVLRGEWGFDGFVVSDWTSVLELLKHGIAADEAEAARKALTAGVDMEMVSRTFAQRLPDLVKRGVVPVAAVDEAVRRILRIKVRAGLFEHPYADAEREKTALLTTESRQLARRAAARSMVLLRNEGGVLPLRKDLKTLAVVGPLADDRRAVIGTWSADGKAEDAVSVLAGIQAALGTGARVLHAKGCEIEGGGDEGFAAAVDAAKQADAVVVVVGESADMSGEASSRSVLDLPGRQMDLVRAVHAAGRPMVVVLLNGRPLTIPWIAEHVPAILVAWHGGTEAGNAAADVLFGDVNPGGKLPITFPRSVGQVPIYYAHKATGRPPGDVKWTSKYLDVPVTPQFPFGHGLSYTTFELSGLKLGRTSVAPGGSLPVEVTVKNTGSRAGDEGVAGLRVRRRGQRHTPGEAAPRVRAREPGAWRVEGALVHAGPEGAGPLRCAAALDRRARRVPRHRRNQLGRRPDRIVRGPLGDDATGRREAGPSEPPYSIVNLCSSTGVACTVTVVSFDTMAVPHSGVVRSTRK
jgi:beta-glucosidase